MEIQKVNIIAIPSQVSELSTRTSNQPPTTKVEQSATIQRSVMVRSDTILSKIELDKLHKSSVSRVIGVKADMNKPTSSLKAKINNPDIWKAIADKLLNNS
jgi:hypothetical protein